MRPKVRGYIPELDGLRGIAILLVMIHRMYPGADSPWFVEAGWTGVDLFFVVSGFLIAGILLDTREGPDYFRNFYARRVLRIFPLFYLLVGAIVLVVPLASPSFLENARSPAWYLVHLGNVPESMLGADPPYWLAPVWSLAIEEQFYLTFPLLVRWSTPRRLALCLVAMFAIAIATRAVTTFAWPENERFQYMFTLCRLDAIAAGCALALLVRWQGFALWYARHSRWLWVAIVGSAGIAVATELDRTTMFGRIAGYSVVAIGFAAIVLRVAMARDTRSAWLFRWAPLRYLGKLCFGLYLLHRPADTLVNAVVEAAGFDSSHLLWIPVTILCAVGLATLSWHFIEQPFLRLKDRFASGRHPSTVTTGRLAAAALLVALVAGCGNPASASDDAPVNPGDTAPTDGRPADPDAPGDVMVDPTRPHVLYPGNRVHSPLTSAVVDSIRAIAMTGTGSDDVFEKVGDSITAATAFLDCFDGAYDLGNHAQLAPTVAHFLAGNAAGTSPFGRPSLAAQGGWTTHELLDGSPSPLDREADLIAPRFAPILLGTNDVRYGRSLWAFAEDLWTIVDRLRVRGIVPILSTMPSNTDPSTDARIPLFDLAVRAIAQGRQVPLVDYHLALEALPARGLGPDGLHPSESPAGACVLTTAGLQYGYNARNLLTLEALDRTRRAWNDQASDATAPLRQGSGTHADPIIATLPFVDLGDTRTGDATFVDYLPCGGSGGGHEIVYRLELANATTIDAYVVDHSADVDVHILTGLSATSCVAGGDAMVSATVGPGTVFVVVDSRTPVTEGEFLLVIHEQ